MLLAVLDLNLCLTLEYLGDWIPEKSLLAGMSSYEMANQEMHGLCEEFEILKGVEHRKNDLIQV